MTLFEAIDFLWDKTGAQFVGRPAKVRFVTDSMLYPDYVDQLQEYVGYTGTVGRSGACGTIGVQFNDGCNWYFPFWALDFGQSFVSLGADGPPTLSETYLVYEAYSVINEAFMRGLTCRRLRVWRSWNTYDLGAVCTRCDIVPKTIDLNVTPIVSNAGRHGLLFPRGLYVPFWALEPEGSSAFQKSAHSKPLPLP